MSGEGLLECTIKQQEDIWSTDVAVPSMYGFTGIIHKAPALIFKSKCMCVCACVPQIEVMHEESQGGSTHVVVTNETEESLSNRRR